MSTQQTTDFFLKNSIFEGSLTVLTKDVPLDLTRLKVGVVSELQTL